MADKVGKGWRKIGKGLAKGWHRVGEELAKSWQSVGGFPCTLQFCNSRSARLEERVCDSMDDSPANYLRHKHGEQKTDKEMSHQGIWWSECPGSVPGINSGRPRGTRDVWAELCGNSHNSKQNVRRTDGTDDGTDGTCPRDRWDTNQGVSHQNSLCLLFFLLFT